MISMDMYRRIKNLKRQNFNHSEIARKVGVDRKTVRKYLQSKDPPSYKPRQRPSRESPLEGFVEQVQALTRRVPEASATDIYELLVEKGYKGSERTVQRCLQKLQLNKPKERFYEQEYAPGEQCQFDFKESIKVPFAESREKLIHLHFSTLPHSGTFVIKAYPYRTYECFMDGVHSFFERIGGQPENIRIDNLSPCVKKVLPHGERLYTDAFKKAINYYDFNVLPCSPGKGNEKGDVERDIRTYANKILNLIALKSLIFKDFDHLNEWLWEFCQKRWRHQDKLETEKATLKALLPRKAEILCRTMTTVVGKYGTIRLGNSTYSVLDHWIGSRVEVISGPYEVSIYRGKEEIKHPRKADGDHSVLLEHTLPSLIRKPQAMIRWRHREILFQEKVFKKLYTHLKSKTVFAEVEFLRVLNLSLNHPLAEVKAATQLCLENPSFSQSLSFHERVSELLGEHRPRTVPEQDPITINLDQFDQLLGG